MRATTVALALGVAQCVPALDAGLSLVQSPRLLAVQVTPAEAAPGETVTLRALVARPTDDGATGAVRWWRCDARRALSDSASSSPLCTGPSDAGALAPIGEGDSVSLVLPQDSCARFGPDPPAPSPGEPSGRPVDPDPTGGYFVPVRVSIGSSLDSIAEVRVRCSLAGAPPAVVVAYNRADRGNENARITALTARVEDGPERDVGDELTVPPSSRVSFRVHWPQCPASAACGDAVCDVDDDLRACAADCAPVRRCAGAERYPYFDRDSRALRVRRESMRVSFYGSAGTFENERVGRSELDPEPSVTNAWTATAEVGLVRLWFVLRDARGGASWKEVLVRVAR